MLRDRGESLTSKKDIRRTVGHVCLVLLFFCIFLSSRSVFAAKKDDSVDKNTISVNVSTVGVNDWFDDRCTNGLDDDGDGLTDNADSDCDGGIKGLRPNVICDENGSKESYYVTPFPTNLEYKSCDKDKVHDDYYSTSTSNETYVQPSDRNFTIKVSASDPSSIDSIKIEWISGVNKSRDAGQYWDDTKLANFARLDTNLNPHKTSFTCKDAVGCEVCVVGGACAHPVIPTGDLGIIGLQQIILFRAVVTDGAMNSVTTGFDETGTSPQLDKFYRLVVCSTSCNTIPETCANNIPVATTEGTSESFTCFEPVPLYTLKWKFKDKDKDDLPGSYVLEVRDRSKGNAIYTASRTSPVGLDCKKNSEGYGVVCEMSAVLFQGFLAKADGASASIEWGNKTYDWRVKIYDNSTESHCLGVSAWSSEWGAGSMASFTTPYALPTPTFTVLNSVETPLNCLLGGCKFEEDIAFRSTSVTVPNTGTPGYKWYIDGPTVYSVGGTATKKFAVGAEMHSAKLVMTDRLGRSCAVEKSFALSATAVPPSVEIIVPPPGPVITEEEIETPDKNASWNEIVPD